MRGSKSTRIADLLTAPGGLDRTDSDVARELGTDHKTVKAVRSALIIERQAARIAELEAAQSQPATAVARRPRRRLALTGNPALDTPLFANLDD